MKSELMKVEERNLADTRIQKARGDSSFVISAQFKALAIKKEAEQLKLTLIILITLNGKALLMDKDHHMVLIMCLVLELELLKELSS